MILVPILGDQLSHGLASLRQLPKEEARVLMMEVMEETTYVRHHKAKIVLILSAMRHFAEELRADGWAVDYIRLDDPDNRGSFAGEVARSVERHRPSSIRIVEAETVDEPRSRKTYQQMMEEDRILRGGTKEPEPT